jgi:hypothetical protein
LNFIDDIIEQVGTTVNVADDVESDLCAHPCKVILEMSQAPARLSP